MHVIGPINEFSHSGEDAEWDDDYAWNPIIIEDEYWEIEIRKRWENCAARQILGKIKQYDNNIDKMMEIWDPDIPIRAYNEVICNFDMLNLPIIDFLISRGINRERFNIRMLFRYLY